MFQNNGGVLSLDRQNALRERFRALRPGWRPGTEVYADLVRRHLPPAGRVLDLGCGRGGLVEQLDHPLERIAGLDPDIGSLAAHRLPALPRAAGFSHALPFAAGSFDLIFCSWLLEHLAAPALDLREIGRVLRPGGHFVFITPNGRHPLAWLNRGLGRLAAVQGRLVARLYGRVAEDTFPTRYRANTVPRLAALAAAAGLTLAEWETIPDPTYLAFNEPLFRLFCRLDPRLPRSMRLHLVGRLIKPG